jgi:hypothetical protein
MAVWLSAQMLTISGFFFFWYSNSGLEDEDPCRRIPKSTVQEQVDECRKNPRHDPERQEGAGYPKLFRNNEKFKFDCAPGTVLKELPLGETVKCFDGSWAHVPNFTRAFLEEDSGKVVRGKLWKLGTIQGAFNSS